MEKSGRNTRAVRNIILILSIVFIIAGIMTDGYMDVWSKAVIICRECIGLG